MTHGRWSRCLRGESEVKGKGAWHLPQPNPTDNPPKHRALQAIQGPCCLLQRDAPHASIADWGMFFIHPDAYYPPLLAYVNTDIIDGQGLSICQQSQVAVSEVLQKGRVGILVDYLQTNRTSHTLPTCNLGRIRSTVARGGHHQLAD